MTQNRVPFEQMSAPQKLMIWAVCLGLTLVMLAVCARAAMWITGVDAAQDVGWLL